MLINSPQYIRLLPQEYLEINTLIKFDLDKKPKLLLRNLEQNKKIILLDHYFDKDGFLIIRIFNHQRKTETMNFFPITKNIFELQKGGDLIEIFEV